MGAGEEVNMEDTQSGQKLRSSAQCPREESCGTDTFFSEELRWDAHRPRLPTWLTIATLPMPAGQLPTVPALSSSQRDPGKP